MVTVNILDGSNFRRIMRKAGFEFAGRYPMKEVLVKCLLLAALSIPASLHAGLVCNPNRASQIKNGKIRVLFVDRIAETDPKAFNFVEQNAVQWSDWANFEFEFYHIENVPRSFKSHIRLTFKRASLLDISQGSSTIFLLKATKGREPNMQITSWGDFKAIVHEFGHALGLQHEHQRPDAKNFIRIEGYCNEHALTAFRPAAASDKYLIDQCLANFEAPACKKNDKVFMTDFDPYSVMFYQDFFNELLISAPPEERRTTWRQLLSIRDKITIATLYPGKSKMDSRGLAHILSGATPFEVFERLHNDDLSEYKGL